jgi:phosphotransferase system enzyme I (PtsP)
MLLELDCRKGEAVLLPSLKEPIGSVSIRHRLESFAASQGLQL